MVSDKGSGLDGNGLLKASAFFMEDTWRLEHLGALGIMGEVAPLGSFFSGTFLENQEKFIKYFKKLDRLLSFSWS